MSISANLERLSYDSPDGCIATGLHREVLSEAVATRTLLAEESGGTFVFDRAAGTVFTLPAPVQGMQFDFFESVTITSNSAKIITDSASTFLLGEVFTYTTATASGAGFAFDGTTHRAITMNGTTTGGIIGTWIRLVALSSTQWMITGLVVGSGTIATPAATS